MRANVEYSGKLLDTYERISSDPDDTERGVNRQQDDTATFVDRAGATLGKDHVENDTSAFRKKKVTITDHYGNTYAVWRVIRPIWAEALQRLRNGEADGLVVYDLDRLARDPRDLEDAIEVVEHYKKIIVSATASEIDLMTESGRMAARIMVTMANKSSADTSRRVKRAALAKAMEGRPAGRRSFGWAKNGVDLHPIESKLVREAVDMLLKGEATITHIVQLWNDSGVTTARGNRWRDTTLRQYLMHPRLAGYRVYWRQGDDGNKRDDKILYRDGEPVMGTYEPILTIPDWTALQKTLFSGEKSKRVFRKASRKYLLSGLLHCGVCGSRMYAAPAPRSSEHVYRCSFYGSSASDRHTLTVSGPSSDEAISRMVLAYLRRQEAALADKEPAAWPRAEELAVAQEKVRELMDAFDKNELPATVVFPKVQQWEGVVSELRADQREWLARDLDERRTPASDIAGQWDSRDELWRRTVVESVLETVLVRRSATGGGRRFDPERLAPVWHTG